MKLNQSDRNPLYLKRTNPTQKNLRKVHQIFYQMEHLTLYQYTIRNYLLKLTNIIHELYTKTGEQEIHTKYYKINYKQ